MATIATHCRLFAQILLGELDFGQEKCQPQTKAGNRTLKPKT